MSVFFFFAAGPVLSEVKGLILACPQFSYAEGFGRTEEGLFTKAKEGGMI